jgi:hypothetical protein
VTARYRFQYVQNTAGRLAGASVASARGRASHEAGKSDTCVRSGLRARTGVTEAGKSAPWCRFWPPRACLGQRGTVGASTLRNAHLSGFPARRCNNNHSPEKPP